MIARGRQFLANAGERSDESKVDEVDDSKVKKSKVDEGMMNQTEALTYLAFSSDGSLQLSCCCFEEQKQKPRGQVLWLKRRGEISRSNQDPSSVGNSGGCATPRYSGPRSAAGKVPDMGKQENDGEACSSDSCRTPLFGRLGSW